MPIFPSPGFQSSWIWRVMATASGFFFSPPLMLQDGLSKAFLVISWTEKFKTLKSCNRKLINDLSSLLIQPGLLGCWTLFKELEVEAS